MNLTIKEIDILLALAESLFEEEVELLEERGEYDLFRKLLECSETDYPKLQRLLNDTH